MGNGASVDSEGDHRQTSRPPSRPASRPASRPGSRSNSQPGTPNLSRRNSANTLNSLAWKSAFKQGKVSDSNLRKIRGQALGRKSACHVTIDRNGFSLQHIRICEGQVVTFEWDDPDGSGFNVTQVVHDGERYRPVVGGFNSGPVMPRGFYEQQLNLMGEYKFVSAGIRCTPLKVEVFARKDVEADLTDDGFHPKVIRVDEGNHVTWHWQDCNVPHAIYECRFSHKKGVLNVKDSQNRNVPTKTDSYRHEFMKPGVYYFQTEGLGSAEMNTCMVHVRERPREFRIEIQDQAYSPSILVIQEGDRVWWYWDKNRCKKLHCVYQIEPPPLDSRGDEPYKPTSNGFKWPNPSKSGLMSQEFYQAGVYYYSDHNFEAAAEYIGTIIVKPKQVEHFIDLSPEGFAPDLLYANTGDRIWWTWSSGELAYTFIITEAEKCITTVAARPAMDEDHSGDKSYMDEELKRLKVQAGLDTVQLPNIGVYHYRIADPHNNFSMCSVLTQAGPRNHTVHVTDSGFEPKVVTIHPGDRIWWIWQDGSKQHNIIQVSHQGTHIKNGFCSGAAMDAPSAFMHSFQTPGVYYYISASVSKSFGAVVVSSTPQVHEVQISSGAITPDPLVTSLNDIVAWTFKGLRQNDVMEVSTVDQLFDAQSTSNKLHPRRCLNRQFPEKGVYHYTTKAFLKQAVKKEGAQTDETRVSSVLVDDVGDNICVRIDSQGFHPKTLHIKKGHSVLWTWKEAGEEAHNIIHVNPPDSDTPLQVIQGGRSFNSGRPVPRNSFLYTFDEAGSFCVASQGAPGFAGSIIVLDDAEKVGTPYLKHERKGGTVEKGTMLKLRCETAEAIMYYTLDGSNPELHRPTTKLYNREKCIVLKNPGLCFVRAMAVGENMLNSEVFTSRRFWVLSDGQGNGDDSGDEEQPAMEETGNQTAMWQWWSCVPVIKACFSNPGEMEVFWEPPPEESRYLVRGYQIFLNGVSYCETFPQTHNSLNIAGLAGGRMYEVVLEVYPNDPMYLPHKSNKLVMKCPKTTGTGGPLVSLERTERPDMLAIVWMAISSEECPIQGYRVYMNGQMCGNEVVPDPESDRCRVVIEGCQLDSIYRIVIAAVPQDGSSLKSSNELQVTLPLDTQQIRLPPAEVRQNDEDMYKEYIEIRDGSGYVPAMEQGHGASLEAPPHQVATIDLTQKESAAHLEYPGPGHDTGEGHRAMGSKHVQREHSNMGYHEEYYEQQEMGGYDDGETEYGYEDDPNQVSAFEDDQDGYDGGYDNGHYGGQFEGQYESPYSQEESGYSTGQQDMHLHPSDASQHEPPSRGASGYSRGTSRLHEEDSSSAGDEEEDYEDEEEEEDYEEETENGEADSYPPSLPLYNPQPYQPSSVVAESKSTATGKQVTALKRANGQAGVMGSNSSGHIGMSGPPVLRSASRSSVQSAAVHVQPPAGHSHLSLPRSGKQSPPPKGTLQLPAPGPSQMPVPQAGLPPSGATRKGSLASASGSAVSSESHHRSSNKPGPYIEGVPYQPSPLKPPGRGAFGRSQNAAPSDDENTTGFIDATQAETSMEPARTSSNQLEVEVRDDESVTTSEHSAKGHTKEKKRKKRKQKPLTVEVQEEAHLQLRPDDEPEVKPSPQVTAAVPVIGHHSEQDEFLPVPVVEAHNINPESVMIKWHYQRTAEPAYRLMVNIVNVVGTKFHTDINSDISFECLQEEGGDAMPAVQHVWNVTAGDTCQVTGLVGGMTYTIFVVANYSLTKTQQPCELQAKSAPIKYTTLGPPPAPVLKPSSTDLYQATLEWDCEEGHKDVAHTGFQVVVDGKPLGDLLAKTVHKTTIDNLQPGRTIAVQVVSATNHPVGNGEPSNAVKVACPHVPPAPSISQQPSYKKGSVIVAWEKPLEAQQPPYGEDILFYRIYLDGSWHGEVRSSATCNNNGYQYCLTDLKPGQCYDVGVKSYCGQGRVDVTSDQMFCLCESEVSNTVPVMCPAPPTSPCLRLDGMNSEGIDITWQMPQQYGAAAVSGFQLLKDGKLYGSIMPPDVHNLHINDISLGDKIKLQILALTDHPVGRHDQPPPNDPEQEIDTSDDKDFQEIYIGDRYSACKPGPKLIVHYTGLVHPPTKVWSENVTGHTAVIVWSKSEKARAHFVESENYQVTWWLKDQQDTQINSQATKDDHLLVTGLKPNQTYTVVVEARRMQRYADIQEGEVVDDGYDNTFILTGRSEPLTLKTSRPPAAPSNLGVIATTCTSIQVAWDPPADSGVDIIAIRVDAVSMKAKERQTVSCIEVMPDKTSAVLENLAEKTEYLITVSAITEEYFIQLPEGHEHRRTRHFPAHQALPEDAWLPSSTMIAMTSGTDPPSEVHISRTTLRSVTISWSPPVVYGSNTLQGTVVRWAEGKFLRHAKDDTSLAHHKSMQADANEATIDDLKPGLLYKIVVEAVVSVKTTVESAGRDPEGEKKNRRTTHVLSKPVFVRTRCPCESPVPIVSGYTLNTIQLYWEKPMLYSVVGKDEEGSPKYQKLSLEGYRLEINGKPHMRLVPTAQSCTLVKCKPGKAYSIVLVALTCTEEVKKERRRKGRSATMESTDWGANKEWETTSEDLENDESPSDSIEVTLPRSQDGLLSELTATYMPCKTGEKEDIGDLQVEWDVQGDYSIINQFNVVWYCNADGNVQTKCVDAQQRRCTVPIRRRKCLYDVTVEPQYNKDVTAPDHQKVQIIIPGSPDPPEIFTRSIGRNEFIIEWGEPRLYGVKIAGYQVFLNGKKVGNELSASHRKAVIPCKSKRSYRVSLVAISADPVYENSAFSNTLLITTGVDGPKFQEGTSAIIQGDPMAGVDPEDDSDLCVRVVRVTDNSIQLDWAPYREPDGVIYYKVTWSSVAQPAEKEVKLPSGEKSCVLHKCFPGTNHFLRVMAIGREDRVLDASRQISVQTCAPPDTPVVKLRACNFKYIAIEWERPSTYGDASIIGYKIYVNGVVEAMLGPDLFTYNHTQGRWCREYAFQVQALTADQKTHSRPSDPLVVTWPGVQPPVLRRVPALSGNSVKVVWEAPPSTDGVKIKQYKVVCVDEESGRTVQAVSQIHPDTTEAEIHNLKQGSYMVFVEVHLHGSSEVIKSDFLQVRPTLTPDPPQISVTVIGLEERRQVEKVACDLINKRDRLMNFLSGREAMQSPRIIDEDQSIGKMTEDLAHVEDMLDDCLASLINYTGHLLAHVTWSCPQSNPDIRVTGYKVLVDGKQYGTTLHSGIKNVRIKLGLTKPSHRLSMVSVCDHPHANSSQSNVVELLTEPFQPFVFFNLLESLSAKSQKVGTYIDVLAQERKALPKKLINQGLLKRHVPPPACTLMEIFEGEYHPLFPPAGPKVPTAILFWNKRNSASIKHLGWFVRYARNHSAKYDFISVACTFGEVTASERQELVHIISDNGWRDDHCVRHLTSHSTTPMTAASEMIKRQSGMDASGGSSSDMAELFGAVGVPMVVVVHPDDYIAWKGRYCAFDYQCYENFLDFVLDQVIGQKPLIPDPWDTNIDLDALDGVTKRNMSDNAMLIHRPTNTLHNSLGHSTTVHMNGHLRVPSSKRVFIRTHKNRKKEITINRRPYSADGEIQSPYAKKLSSSGSLKPRRAKSGHKFKGY